MMSLIFSTFHQILLGLSNQLGLHGKACGTIREIRNAHKILVQKPEEKRTIRRRRHRWADDIKMELKEIERVWT
jgi:hypothetical protein